MLNILKIIFMFPMMLFTIVNIVLEKNKQDIPAINFIFQTIGIIGFIVIQFKLY
jgi:hypothetical protein